MLEHIEFLLSQHDCVIVPGLGAFLATYEPSRYLADKECFTSPRRVYAFNSGLTVSDGLLVSSIARSRNIDYSAAAKVTDAAVERIHAELNRNGEFTFGRIGRLETTLMGALHFESFAHDKLTPAIDWLGDIPFKSLQAKSRVADSNDDTVVRRHKIDRQIKIKRFVRTAVGAAAAILLAIVISTPVSVKNTFTASTVPPVRLAANDADAEIVAEELPLSETSVQAEAETPADSETQAIVENALDANVEASEECIVPNNSEGNYVLVVASFSNSFDAEKFISQQKGRTGLDFDIVQAGDKYRVYAASSDKISDLTKLASESQIGRHFPESWVARR